MATTEDREGLHATQAWRAERYAASSEREALFTTVSGLPVEPLSTPDTVDIDYHRDLGFPGEPNERMADRLMRTLRKRAEEFPKAAHLGLFAHGKEVHVINPRDG